MSIDTKVKTVLCLDISLSTHVKLSENSFNTIVMQFEQKEMLRLHLSELFPTVTGKGASYQGRRTPMTPMTSMTPMTPMPPTPLSPVKNYRNGYA